MTTVSTKWSPIVSILSIRSPVYLNHTRWSKPPVSGTRRNASRRSQEALSRTVHTSAIITITSVIFSKLFINLELTDSSNQHFSDRMAEEPFCVTELPTSKVVDLKDALKEEDANLDNQEVCDGNPGTFLSFMAWCSRG